MKKITMRIVSWFLVVTFFVGFLPTTVMAKTEIKDPAMVQGSRYTTSPILAAKLDQVFAGNIPLYSNIGCTNQVKAPLGSYPVVPGITRYCQTSKGTPWSGQSCYIYANAVYRLLFGEMPGCEQINSVKIPCNKRYTDSNCSEMYYLFNEVGVKTGTYIRTTGHSLIVLSYSKSGVNYIDGNGDKKGGVKITEGSWLDFHKIVTYNDRVIDHFVIPKDDYYYENYFKMNFLTETACDKYLQTAESDVRVRTGPGKKYPEAESRKPLNEVVHAVAYYVNQYGNLWYKLDNGHWIYSERLKALSTYKISYNANGGSGAPQSQTKKRNQNITLSYVEPFRKGHEFLGWSTSKNAKAAEYQPGATYSKNKSDTLYAVYRKKNTTIKLSDYVAALNLDNGKSKSITVTLAGDVENNYKLTVTGDSVVSVKSSSISVSSFLGFNKKGEATVTITPKAVGDGYVYVTSFNGDGEEVAKTLVAVSVTKTYNVKFNANGGTGAPADQKKTSGKTLTLSNTIPTRKNYKFMGWATSASSSTPVKGPGDLYQEDKDITYYAIWNEDYHIDWSFNNGTLNITGYGDMAYFSKNNPAPWAEYKSNTTNIVIGSGVSSVGSYAFYGFDKVTNVSIPRTVKNVGSYAFANCIKLLSVEAPIDMSIGNKAFSNCSSLSKYNKKSDAKISTQSITEETQGTIGAFAFENCENLQAFEIPNGTTAIGEGAFSGCASLNTVVIPGSVTKIEDTVFSDCVSLETVSIPDTINEISDGAFQGCSNISTIDIPEGVNTLGEQSFAGCTSLTSVTLPEDLIVVGDSLFANCSSLTDVTLPNDMKVLGNSMFSGCTSLENINLPENLNNLGDGTFFGCSSLTNIDIPASVTEIGSNAFAASALTKIEIPSSVATIDSFAFYNCKQLQDVVLEENLLDIGSCAFASCTALKSIEIPTSVKDISSGAFMNCTSLSSVSLADVEVYINDEAFAGCTALKNITIPSNAAYVSPTAFNACSESLTVTCFSTSAALNGVAENDVNCEIIYPVTSVEIKGNKTELKKGESLQLEAVISPSNATNKNVVWSCENEDIARVSDSGIVTAVSSGIATISVKTEDGNYIAYYQINCVVPVEDITINNPINRGFVGYSYSVSYSLNPDATTNIDVIFESSDENVAIVTNDGVVDVLSEGVSTITIKSADGNAEKSFVLIAENYVPVREINSNLSEVSLRVGETFHINATISPSNASFSTIYYYSVNDDVATVDANGKIVAVNKGEAQIVCVADAVETVYTISVSENISIAIKNPSAATINYGDTLIMHADLNGVVLPEGWTIQWNVDGAGFNMSSAEDGLTCKMTSVANGTATVKATIVDENGEAVLDAEGNEISDSKQLTSKAGFWQKIVSFFKNLFRISRVILQSI